MRQRQILCTLGALMSFILLRQASPQGALQQERFLSVDNVCAWPNLSILPNGSIAAVIFNQPSHGVTEGDIDCWVSTDGGRLWSFRGVVAPHEPKTNRVNVAAGVAHDGSLVVLSSGTDLQSPRSADGSYTVWKFLPVMICRSSDQGRTWERSFSLSFPDGLDYLIPFGDIIKVDGRTLAASLYVEHRYSETARRAGRPHDRTGTSYVLFSRDDGRTWGDAAVLAPEDYNETSILRLGPHRWLAAARTYGDAHMDLFVSENEGRNWKQAGPLSLPRQHPAHLLRLADGKVLLTYGVREQDHQGIAYRWSDDEGRTWKAPTMLVHLPGTTDGGYPSTVQLADGMLLTAYYSNGIPEHRRYHMGSVRWRLEK